MSDKIFRFAVALGAVTLSLAITSLTPPLLAASKFMMALSAVMFAAWYGGLGPGVLALTLAAFVLGTAPPFAVHEPAEYIRLAFFVLMSLGIVLLASSRRRTVHRLSSLNDELRRAIDQRREAERAAVANEARKAAILDAAMDAIITISHEGTILEFNAAAEEMFGYKRHDAIGQEMAALIVPEQDREGHRKGLRRAVRTGEEHASGKRLEFCATRSDGGVFPVEVTITRVKQGEPPIFTGFIRDLTAQKRAERELRDRDERLALAFQAARLGSWEADFKEGRVTLSENAESILSTGANTLTMDQFFTLFGAEAHEVEQALKAGGEKEDNFFEIETSLTKETESRRWVLLLGRGIVDSAANRSLRAVGILQDITSRKRIEEALRHSEHVKTLAIESSDDCVNFLDTAGNLLFMNASGQRLLEIEDITPYLKTSWIDFWKGRDYQAATQAVQIAATGGTGRFTGYCPTARNEAKWWDVMITPIAEDTTETRTLLCVSRDVTQQKMVEQRLQETIAALEGSKLNLQEKVEELERFHDVVVGRELKMMELEQEIRRLKAELDLMRS